jgi:stage V sporulation protein B
VGPAPAEHLAVIVPLAIAQLALNLLMQADIWMLRPLADDAGRAAGLAGAELLRETDRLVGGYRAAQLFAFLPYQLLLSITFILFPMLAKAHAEKDREAVATYVRAGVRLASVLAGMFVAVIGGLAPHVLRFAFPRGTDELAAGALRVLALGQGAFTLFGIQANVLGSLGKERWSAIVTAIAAATVAGLCLGLVPGAAFGPALLARTATATATALAVAAFAGAILVRRAAGAFVAPLVLARVGVALGLATLVGTRLPWLGRVPFLAEAALVALVYLGSLVVTGELGRADLAVVQRTLARRRA